MDWGGGMLFVVGALAAAVLGCALVYGGYMRRNRPRDSAMQHASDEATEVLYHPRNDVGNKPLTR